MNQHMTKLYLLLSFLPFVAVFILSLTIVLLFKFLPERLPLFYSLPWGDSQLATHQQFFIIPAIIILITITNLMISYQLHQAQIFFKKILVLSSLLSTVILIVTFIKIVLLFI